MRFVFYYHHKNVPVEEKIILQLLCLAVKSLR